MLLLKAVFPAPGDASKYIHENYAETIQPGKIAKKAGLQKDDPGRVFKKEPGKTIVNFTKNYRVDKAFELMKTTSMNISEIHQKVGFSHSSHFAWRK
ncbi:MAG: helix-turn-helix domain-containing protein [Fibrobacterota bacterium]